MDTSYCRLCAKMQLSSELINIFSDNLLDFNANISYLIFHCFRISITRDDNLPKLICPDCYQQSIASFQFYEKILDTQKVLKAIFNNTNVYKNDEVKVETSETDSHTKFENEQYSSDDEKKSDFGDFNHTQNESIFDTKNQPTFDSNLYTKSLITSAKNDDFKSIQTQNNQKNPKFIKSKRKSRKLVNKTKSSILETKKTDWQKQLEEFKKKVAEEFKDYVWQCHICSNLQFKTKNQLVDHFKCHHQKPVEYSCVDCTKIFTNGIQFKWHVRSHRRNVEFRCKICDKWFSKGAHYRGHMYSVHEQPHTSRVTCPKCNKTFKSTSSLKIHDLYIHQGKNEQYECDICHKKLKRKGFLKAHKKIHEDKKYICENCGVAFLTKGNLESHIICKHSINEGDAPIETCTLCSKSFKTRVHLANHINRMHKNKGTIHECEVCGKKVRGKTKFDQHQTLHTGELRYMCQYCQKRFRLKSTLRVHIRQHTGERPYSCHECKRDFVNTSNFRKHMKRKHNGIIKINDMM